MFIYVHLLYRLERPASWVNLLTRHSLENAFLVWWRGGQEWMQSLASLAVERHAMDPRGFAWRLRGSTPPPSGFNMPGFGLEMQGLLHLDSPGNACKPLAFIYLVPSGKCKVFCTSPRLGNVKGLCVVDLFAWFRVDFLALFRT